MSIVIVWYNMYGHDPADVTERPILAPWYPTKSEPAFEDILVKLRRTIIAARFFTGPPSSTHPCRNPRDPASLGG